MLFLETCFEELCTLVFLEFCELPKAIIGETESASEILWANLLFCAESTFSWELCFHSVVSSFVSLHLTCFVSKSCAKAVLSNGGNVKVLPHLC